MVTKKDWLDILRTLGEKDIFDYITLGVNIVSPILLILSIWISYKAVVASKESTILNQQMYEDQKKEYDLSFVPIFKAKFYSLAENNILFSLINKNEKDIIVTSVVGEEPLEASYGGEIEDREYNFTVHNYNSSKGYIKIWVHYKTLNHKSYSTEVTLRNINDSFIIESQKTNRKEKNVIVPQH